MTFKLIFDFLRYLDISGNPFIEDVSRFIPKLSKLTYVNIKDTSNSNGRARTLADGPVEFQKFQGLRFLLNIKDSNASLCGACSPAVQYSGNCHELSCANNATVDLIQSQVDQCI